jgi:hypothetical protein
MYWDAGTVSVIVVAARRAPAGIWTEVPPRLTVAPSVVTSRLFVCVSVAGHWSSVGELGDRIAVELLLPPHVAALNASAAAVAMRETVTSDLDISNCGPQVLR